MPQNFQRSLAFKQQRDDLSEVMERLVVAKQQATAWLFHVALPFWWAVGADHERGGFHESVLMDGTPSDEPRRARVQARQVFVFAQAARLGWSGPAKQAVRHGIKYLLEKFKRPDGSFRHKVTAEGECFDDTPALYDQAFCLFALGHAANLLQDKTLKHAALELIAYLKHQRTERGGGYTEAEPQGQLLLANPHMHLLEGALAWIEHDRDPVWMDFANDIASLCLDRFICPQTGCLREYFRKEWQLLEGPEGQIWEPGHHFEWAWLLARLENAGGQKSLNKRHRLVELGESRGINPTLRTARNELLMDFSVHSENSRIWPQTERLKAALTSAMETDGDLSRYHLENAADSAEVIFHYLDKPLPALWFETMKPDGSFIEEDVRASTLYHVVGAFSELLRFPLLQNYSRPA